MTGDAELVTGDPHWHNFLPGISPVSLSFTAVEASWALSRDVLSTLDELLRIFHPGSKARQVSGRSPSPAVCTCPQRVRQRSPRNQSHPNLSSKCPPGEATWSKICPACPHLSAKYPPTKKDTQESVFRTSLQLTAKCQPARRAL